MQHQPLSSQLQIRGMKVAILGQTIGTILPLLVFGATGTLFIKAVGGSDFQALLFGTLSGLTRFVRIPCSLFVPEPMGRSFLITAYWLSGFSFLGALVLPVYFPDWDSLPTGVVALLLLGTLLMEAGKTHWWPLLHAIVPEDRRGRFFSILRISWALSSFFYTLGAGYYLSQSPELKDFLWVLGIALILFFLRNPIFKGLPQAQETSRSQKWSTQHWRMGFRGFWGNPRTSSFLIVIFAYALGFSFFTQPIILYMNDLGLSKGQNVILNGLSFVGQIIALASTGKFLDKKGSHRIYQLSLGLLFLTALAVPICGRYLSGTPLNWSFSLFIALAWLGKSATDLAMTVDMLRLSPKMGRAFFVALISISYGLCMAFGPFVSALMVKTGLNKHIQLWGFQFYECLFLGVALLAALTLVYRLARKSYT